MDFHASGKRWKASAVGRGSPEKQSFWLHARWSGVLNVVGGSLAEPLVDFQASGGSEEALAVGRGPAEKHALRLHGR